jgi:hypothetical protein
MHGTLTALAEIGYIFGSKIVFWIRIRIGSGFNKVSGSVKITHKIEKIKKFHVLKFWMFSLRAAGFFCSLDVLYVGLWIGKLQFFYQKKY